MRSISLKDFLYLVCVLSFVTLPKTTHAAALPPDTVIHDSMRTEYPDRGRYLWASLGMFLAPNLTKTNIGSQVSVGLEWNPIGVDLRGGFGAASYSAIRGYPDAVSGNSSVTDESSALDPTSELNRTRGDDDSWTYFFVQPGISIENKFVQDRWPLWSNRVRIGLGYALMTDGANSIAFSSWMYSGEATVGYRLGHQSQWMVEAGFSLNFAIAQSGDRDGQVGMLPLNFSTVILGVKRWF